MSIKLCHVYKVQNIRPSIHWVLNKTPVIITAAVTTGTTTAAVITSISIITTSGSILQLQSSLILPSLFSSLEFALFPNE